MSAIESYFNAERTTGLLFMAVGMLAIGVTIWAWDQGAFWRGAAGPLVIVALVQLGVGFSVWRSSHQDIERVQHIVAREQVRIAGEEIPRMEAVMKSFVTNRRIEIAVFAMGLLLFGLAAQSGAWQGVGAGLAWQAGLVLLLDSLAEQRGHAYLKWLQAL